MGKVRLLDCTLRDGGYINDWRFGTEAIDEIISGMTGGAADIFEIGFLKNELYQKDRTVFNRVSQIAPLLGVKNPKVDYAAMIEVVNPLPLEFLEEHDGTSVDIIRVIVWKRLLQEGFDYCKGVIEKGYRLCVQPARVDQYSDEEFIEMCELFSKLSPMAVYVVDSWGTQSTQDIMHYVHLADEHLKDGIAIGYHGHNNLMQAYGTAIEFVRSEINRELIVDASIYGIGRGAGNLNLELFATYLNEHENKSYTIPPMIDVYDRFLKQIYEKHPWGYSLPFYLTAVHGCNPNYANYYGMELGLPAKDIDRILQLVSAEDKIIFKKENADKYMMQYKTKM